MLRGDLLPRQSNISDAPHIRATVKTNACDGRRRLRAAKIHHVECQGKASREYAPMALLRSK